MQIDTTRHTNRLIVHVRETRIDAASAIEFKEQMRSITQSTALPVLLDLSCVTFIDSSGLGAVVAVRKALDPGRLLELAGLTPAVEKVFRLTRMDSVFPILPALPADLPDDLRDAV